MAYKIFNPKTSFDTARDWGIDEASEYPIKIATVPALCTESYDFTYRPEMDSIDFSQFDLVLISDIEMRTISSIQEWIQKVGIQRCIVAVGSLHDHEKLPDNFIYRPWWCYNYLSLNTFVPTPGKKTFTFDVLLGARRPHRDYIMLAFQHSELLSQSIVNYRELFVGTVIDELTNQIHQLFPQPMIFPYVSPNMNPEWEVSTELYRAISAVAPIKIFENTKYSIVCETLYYGGGFFFSEKPSKAMFSKRVFVPISTANYIGKMRELGFKWFENILDDSFDSERDDINRWRLAMIQIQRLSNMDYDWVISQTQHIVEHNYQHMFDLQKQTQSKMKTMFIDAIASAQTTIRQ